MPCHEIHWIHTRPKMCLSNGDPIYHLSPGDGLCNAAKTTLCYINHPWIHISPTAKEGFINHPTLCRMRLRATTATLTPLCISFPTLSPFFVFTKILHINHPMPYSSRNFPISIAFFYISQLYNQRTTITYHPRIQQQVGQLY